jgi:hypothetical protein
MRAADGWPRRGKEATVAVGVFTGRLRGPRELGVSEASRLVCEREGAREVGDREGTPHTR